MWKQLLPGFRMTLLLTVVTGLIYPGAVTGLCQLLFPARANGSLIVKDGKVVGSSLIGQNFSKPEYFQGRPSAAGSDGYDASASSGSNLGPTSQKLIDRVKTSVAKLKTDNPEAQGAIPSDLLTTSASGLDPHISPESANLQVARVAKARGVSTDQVAAIVGQMVEGRDLGVLGEARVNVLQLNLKLDAQFPVQK